MNGTQWVGLALLGMAMLSAEARIARPLPQVGGAHMSIARDVLVTVQLTSVREVAANGDVRPQNSTLSLRQLVSMRSHYAGSMKDTERRSHAPLACWGVRTELSECGPGQRFNGAMTVRGGNTQPAVFRFNELRWQAGDAVTVHTQNLVVSANDREERPFLLTKPVMKAIPLRDALEAGRHGQAADHVIRLEDGRRALEFTYSVRVTPGH